MFTRVKIIIFGLLILVFAHATRVNFNKHLNVLSQNGVVNTFATKSSDFQVLGGSVCNGTSNTSCNSTNACIYGDCNFVTLTCQFPSVVNIGDACNYYDVCSGGGACSGIYTSPTGVGTCQLTNPLFCNCTFDIANTYGGVFSLDQTCDTNYCAPNGKCDYQREPGDVCTQNYECYSSSCVNGICVGILTYGAACNDVNNQCPFDAYCDTGNSNTCVKYGTNGDDCTLTACNPYYFCDSMTKFCVPKYSKSLGETCYGGGCPYGSVCNITANQTGICTPATSFIGTPCTMNTDCIIDSLECLCTNSGSSSCQPISNLNCQSQVASYYQCALSNCPNDFINAPIDGSDCKIQKCGNQYAAVVCCETNYNYPLTQASVPSITRYFDCNSNTFLGSSCVKPPSPSPSVSASLTASISTVIIAVLLSILFFEIKL